MDNRRVLRYSVGAMLCWLLLMYAVGAKLALYHTGQPGARSVAATKAWEDQARSVDIDVAPVLAAPTIISLALLLGLVFATAWPEKQNESTVVSVYGFSPHISVRPPPIS